MGRRTGVEQHASIYAYREVLLLVLRKVLIHVFRRHKLQYRVAQKLEPAVAAYGHRELLAVRPLGCVRYLICCHRGMRERLQ